MSIALADANATRALGARLARALDAQRSGPLLIALAGELGAGKTTLVGGLLAALGHDGPARSPTYTLVEPYRFGDREIWHCDLYRLVAPEAVDDLGLRDALTGANVLLVEWLERAGGRLGRPDLVVALEYAGDARRVELTPYSEQGRRLVATLGVAGVGAD
jgi:tRNA threonylcarbamoyladenosine biosynthesis protein TsaE